MKKIVVLLVLFLMLLPKVITANNETKGIAIHVSPNGSDTASGSIDNPLHSISGAKSLVRTLDKNQPITVIFHEGTYYLDNTVNFTLEDSGSDKYPVVYKAADNEKVRFAGTTVLNPSKFVPVTDADVLSRLPEASRNYVMQLDLKEHGINSLEEINPLNYEGSTLVLGVTNMNTLFLDNKPQMIAQWPNGEANYVQFEKVLKQSSKTEGGSVVYKNSRIKNWTLAKNAFVGGFFAGMDYFDSTCSLSGVDSENNILYMGKAMYGLGEASKRFKVFNLLEELDLPTEWYIDREKMVLYYFPPYSMLNSNMELVTLMNDMFSFDNAQNITIKDVEFCGTAKNGVYLTNACKNIEISSCTFRSISKKGIFAEATYRKNFHDLKNMGNWTMIWYKNHYNIVIEDCNFFQIGLEAIKLMAGNCETFTPSGSYIINNNIYDVAQWGTEAAILPQGYDITVKNNLIHKARFHAVNPYYMETKVLNNEIYNVAREVYDAGAVYTGHDLLTRGNEIAYNFIHDYLRKDELIGFDVVGVFIDDGGSGTHVHHNIIRQGAAGIQIGGGNHNKVHDNIILEQKGNLLNTDNRGETWDRADMLAYEQYVRYVTAIDPEYVKRYPDILETEANLHNGHFSPVGNQIYDNIMDKGNEINERMEELGKVENNLAIPDSSVFVDTERNDFRLKARTDFAIKFPNALTNENFDLKSVGLQVTNLRKELPCFDETTSPFRKMYPLNGMTDINGSDAYLMWENAQGADSYTVTIATDPEMKNIVLQEKSFFNYLKVKSLGAGLKTYYWAVEAHNESWTIPSTWKSTGVPHMFTVTKYSVLEKEGLYQAINEAKVTTGKIKDGDLAGEFPIGTAEEAKNVVKKAEQIFSLTGASATQEDINETLESLNMEISAIAGKMKTDYADFSFLFGTPAAEWKTSKSDAVADITKDSANLKSLSKDTNFSVETMPGVSEINCFKMKFDWTGKEASDYFALSLRSEGNSGPIWNYKNYAFLFKPNQIEFQYWSKMYERSIFETYSYSFPNNKWIDVQVGAVNTIFGTKIFLVMDGKKVIDYLCSGIDSITDQGYFSIYMPKAGYELQLKNEDDLESAKLAVTKEKEASDFNIKHTDITGTLEDMESWNAFGGTKKSENGIMSFEYDKGKDSKTSSSLAYIKPMDNQMLYNMDVKLNPADKYQTISLRTGNQTETGNVWDAGGYSLILKQDWIELQRFSNGNRQYLGNVKNNGLYTQGEFVNLKFGTVDTFEGGVRCIVYMNNKLVFDFYDENALEVSGLLAFYDYSGGGFDIKAPSMGDVTLDEPIIDEYREKGNIYNTDSAANITKKYGSWTNEQIGAEGKSLLAGAPDNEGGPVELSQSMYPSSGIYKLYYWVGKGTDGDENATLEIFSSGEATMKYASINFKEGQAGWVYLGSTYPSDGSMNLTIKGSGKGKVYHGAFKLVKSNLVEWNFTQLFDYCKNGIVIKLGSNKAFVKYNKKILNAAPVEEDGRTLVPIRFVTEAFGAEVSWDEQTASATIYADGHELKFTQNQTSYTYDGNVRLLDKAAEIINDSMMLPIRVISEDLGKNVYWEESGSGLIVISDESNLNSKQQADYIGAAINMFTK